MFLGQVQWFESRDVDEVLNIFSKVIGKLSSGEKGHVNYRDSKLTHILQNSLGKALKPFSFIESMFRVLFSLAILCTRLCHQVVMPRLQSSVP